MQQLLPLPLQNGNSMGSFQMELVQDSWSILISNWYYFNISWKLYMQQHQAVHDMEKLFPLPHHPQHISVFIANFL